MYASTALLTALVSVMPVLEHKSRSAFATSGLNSIVIAQGFLISFIIIRSPLCVL